MAIKADATLVNAAFREGQTRAMGDVPNMKPLFDSTASIQKTYTDTMTNVIDQLKERKEQEDIAKEKGLKPVNNAAKGVYSAIYDGGEPLPSVFVDAFTGRVEALQAEFEKVNTEGKGDTKANARKRREISGELMRLKNEAVNVRKNFMISTQDPDKWNESRIDKNNIDPLNSIFGLWKDPNNTPKGITAKIVNGKLQVTTSGYSTRTRTSVGFVEGSENEEGMPEIDYDSETEWEEKVGDARTFTSEDIVGALNYENAENDSYLIDSVNSGATQGEVAGKVKGAEKGVAYGDRNNQQDATDLTAWFKEDPKRFDDIVGRGVNGLTGDEGFKKAIRVNPNISLDIINTMFTDDVDLRTKIAELDVAGGEDGGDGVIDSEDLEGLTGSALKNFNKNWDMVESALTDSEDPNFSEKVSFPLIAEYYANFKKQNYDDSYTTTWEQNNKEETPAHLIKGSIEWERWNKRNDSDDDDDSGSKGKIDLGVSRLTNQRVYATRVDVKAKYDQIIGSKKGDAIEGWDGKKTYQYLNRGNGKWQYQVWDSELQQFVTKGGDKEAAGGGEGTKIIDINSVIGELIPQTMLQNSNKTKFTW